MDPDLDFFFHLFFILDLSTKMVAANQRPHIQYHSQLVRTTELYTLYATLRSSVTLYYVKTWSYVFVAPW